MTIFSLAAMALQFTILLAAAISSSQAATVSPIRDSNAPAVANPPSSVMPVALEGLSAEERLAICKAAFLDTVRQHRDASRQLKDSRQRDLARQQAIDQALAVAVLDEAAPDSAEPTPLQRRLAVHRQHRPSILEYCRTTTGQYIDRQLRIRPRYLLDLKPLAQAIAFPDEVPTPDDLPLIDEPPDAVERSEDRPLD